MTYSYNLTYHGFKQGQIPRALSDWFKFVPYQPNIDNNNNKFYQIWQHP